MKKTTLLKNISFEEWNKITNPWGKYENENSLIRKIIQSSVLIKKEAGKSGLYFTRSGWDKFKNFIYYTDHLDEWGEIKTEAVSNFPDYNVYVDKRKRENENDWEKNWVENVNYVSKILEEFVTEEKDNAVNKKVYDFMVEIMGDQEVEYEIKEEKPIVEGSVKNILLIGRTGGGKSTLGNVLVNKNDRFEAVFKESAGTSSETKGYKVETLKVGNDTYRIIDTIGIGDTSLSEGDTLFELGRVAQELELGINQIFFVGRDRFTKEEIEAFRLLGLVLFDKGVEDYASIVRTRFDDFRKEEECKKDIEDLKNASPELREVVKSVGERVIHTDAPPRSRLENLNPKYDYVREDWRDSNKKLWDFLDAKKNLNYLPQNLKSLNGRIKKYLDTKEEEKNKILDQIKKLESQINDFKKKKDEIKDKLKEEKKKREDEIKRIEDDLKKKADDLRKELKEKREKSEEEIKKLERDLEKQKDELKEKRTKTEAEIKRLEKDLETKEEKLRNELKERKNQSNKEVKRLDDELLRLEKQQEEENKKHREEMQRLQKNLADMKKQAVVNAVKEHENSIYGDLRNNYMECISQGAKTVDDVLPFGGKIVGGTIGATLGFLGGVGSWLAYLLRGK